MQINNNQFNAIDFGVGQKTGGKAQQTTNSADALKFLDRGQNIQQNPFSSNLYERIEQSVREFQSLNVMS